MSPPLEDSSSDRGQSQRKRALKPRTTPWKEDNRISIRKMATENNERKELKKTNQRQHRTEKDRGNLHDHSEGTDKHAEHEAGGHEEDAVQGLALGVVDHTSNRENVRKVRTNRVKSFHHQRQR